ncbi:endonuclease NucS domain-containing protein [Vibrio europaeus]|uniref:endonuclease NucS domain-containing protein n=1 Tax=Vibrio europaeus TaxID=300876 RepID=UPI00233F365A|nr:endonuclease NucS domain-containing protein [Vibrio europaeus]MDC5855722.1 endonuclease NucS [Vibrio europaeus]
MLYKLEQENDEISGLEPVEFQDLSSFGKLEKDLENLIANNILELLFEDSKLMPVFQERQFQAEADLYALNEQGELVIFELKRSSADSGAVQQVLRYAEDAGQWTYSKLEKKFKQYTGDSSKSLVDSHKDAFELEHKLEPKEINRKQHLIVIGSAADESLISSIDYWKNNGLSIEFLPYRIYELDGKKYFEFFAPPYDKHKNPRDVKGVLFDTNRTYDSNGIWHMLENSRLEAYGEAKRFVGHVNEGDIVFFSHKGHGVVAAGKVKSKVYKPDGDTWYREVDFLTPIPCRGDELALMSFSDVSEFLGKSFFWARTIKVPYLTKQEALDLVQELKIRLG